MPRTFAHFLFSNWSYHEAAQISNSATFWRLQQILLMILSCQKTPHWLTFASTIDNLFETTFILTDSHTVGRRSTLKHYSHTNTRTRVQNKNATSGFFIKASLRRLATRLVTKHCSGINSLMPGARRAVFGWLDKPGVVLAPRLLVWGALLFSVAVHVGQLPEPGPERRQIVEFQVPVVRTWRQNAID